MRLGSRNRALLLASGAAATISAAVLALPGVGSAKTSDPHCARSQLLLQFMDEQAGLGHRYVDYGFKNVGSSSCTLTGYPRVMLQDKHGHVMTASRAKVTHDSVSPVQTVVIEPGKHGFFTFTWVDGAFCPPHAFTFYGLLVFPPHDKFGFHRQTATTTACPGLVRVTAVRSKLFDLGS